jgi:[acyl-carrier-protein] S-malonyltransferase
MKKTAFLFSGQGSQYAGMGKELCENFTAAKNVYDAASEEFGYDVLKLSCEGSDIELAQTVISQPLIFTLSMAAYSVIAESGFTPDAVVGFSLGEVSALTAAGAIKLETGLKVIKERAVAMQAAAESTPGVMFAVIGASSADVEKICAEASELKGGYVVPVNYNCPGQIVLAGEEESAQAAANILSESGIRVVQLKVNAAFHSKLMTSAAIRFYDKISNLDFERNKTVFYSNINGDKEDISDVADYLKRQMTSPVRFDKQMESMSRDGFDSFVEFGPGKTLCGFIRRGIKGASSLNVEDLKTVQKCLEALSTRNVTA